MKHRITYLHEPCVKGRAESLDPNLINVTTSSVELKRICGAKEHRVTISLSDLPDHASSLLQQSHELHVRWSSPQAFHTAVPLISRLPPGLHVFFTPKGGWNDTRRDSLCAMLESIFSDEIKCQSYEESFISPKLVSERFATSATSQFYAFVPSLSRLVSYFQKHSCSSANTDCQNSLLSLLSSKSLDIDYDAISHVLTIAAYWDKPLDSYQAWNDVIQLLPNDQIEVGVLKEEVTSKSEELSMSGFLTVIGQDNDPKPTMFSFPSRHHLSTEPSKLKPSTFTAHFEQPTNLHPTLHILIDNAAIMQSATEGCALHAYLTIPSILFLDKHAFSDNLFLRSHNLISLRSLSGVMDLEAPEWSIKQWGSTALFELVPPLPGSRSGNTNVHDIEIPLHSRYVNPVLGGYSNASIPYPNVFWACKADAGSKFPVNPFDRRNLGFDGLFGDRTVFYHLQPHATNSNENTSDQLLYDVLTIPALNSKRTGPIEIGTIATVLLGFLLVCWNLLGGVSSKPRHVSQSNTQDEKSKRF